MYRYSMSVEEMLLISITLIVLPFQRTVFCLEDTAHSKAIALLLLILYNAELKKV